MFQAKFRSDKRKVPTLHNWEYLTADECKKLSGYCCIVDWKGDVARVKITKVKTWKTRSDIEVHWKFGLYEYGITLITDSRPNTEFVKEI